MKRLFALLLMLTMLFLSNTSPVSADARSDYESYVAAYNAYRNAVNEGKPVDEVMKLLSSYQAAKAAYEGSLNRPPTTPRFCRLLQTQITKPFLKLRYMLLPAMPRNHRQRLKSSYQQACSASWNSCGPKKAVKTLIRQ